MNNYKEKILNNPILKKIAPFCREVQTYVVGGFLRDLLLGRESSDIDIVVPAGNAKGLTERICAGLGAYFVPLDEENRIYRAVLPDKTTYIDVADIEGDGIEQDLKRRDFTINAIGFDLKNAEFIDVTGGIKDIEAKIIRQISEKNITDDPLRILRAFRFQSELGFGFSAELEEIIERHARELEKSAKERVNVELIKLFAGKNAKKVLISMDECGILAQIFPEVEKIRKIPPNSHHHLPLLGHCIETVEHVQEFYENAPEEAKNHFESVFCGSKRLGFLKLAAFLHDIGKPDTWTIEPDTGRHRFIKHDDVGSKIVEKPLRNLKFSKKQIKYVQKLIKYHIYPASIVTGENYTDKAVLRFFRKMEDEVFDVIAVAYGDRLSARGPEITEKIVNDNINGLKNLMMRYIQTKNEIQPLEKLLDGREIMEICNIPQSPRLGEVIKALKEAQMSSEVKTRDEAVEFVKNFRQN